MPRHMASNPISHNRRAWIEGSPIRNMRLVSPWKPSLMTVMSTLRMSPGLRTLSPGMPWQTTWLTEVQIDFGNPL